MQDCSHCPLRASCTSPCAWLQAQLEEPIGPRIYWSEREEQERLRRTVRNMSWTRTMIRYRGELKGLEQKVVNLFFNEGKGFQEIGELIGKHRNSVGNAFARAIRKVIAKMEEEREEERVEAERA